jgi:hypothetical protein
VRDQLMLGDEIHPTSLARLYAVGWNTILRHD